MKTETIVTEEIKRKAIKSVKWTALSEIASRSIQPIVTLILARLLTPADFGVVGVAMIAIGLAQIFQDFGLGKTLIQRETEVQKSANIVFWTNLTLSIVIYFIIFLSAPLLSKFFHEPKVIDVLRVLCLQIILSSFVSVHQALSQRNFEFKQLFFIRLSSAIVPGFVSIPLALLGYGVWSLVFGTLAGAVAQVFIFWRASQWRPKFSYDVQLAKQLFGFSAWVVLEAFLGWLIMWGDSIVLGHFLGVKELGVYRVGVTFLMLVFGIFFNPLLPVAYSAFSRLQSNPEELKQSFLKMTKLIASISLPIGVGLAILAQPISSIIFGQKWEGIEIVIMILGLQNAIGWTVGLNNETFRAIGRPDVNAKLLFTSLISYIPVYVLAAPYGLSTFCIARLAVTIIGIALHIFFANRVLKLSFTYLYRCMISPLIGSFMIGVIVYSILHITGIFHGWQGGLKILEIIFIGGSTYFFILRLLERDRTNQLFLILLKVIGK